MNNDYVIWCTYHNKNIPKEYNLYDSKNPNIKSQASQKTSHLYKYIECQDAYILCLDIKGNILILYFNFK